jgi:hypothetical protein
MKNPTVNGNDLYQVGNDYPQAPISAYFEEGSYADGIYTKITNTEFDVKSQDGHDDSFFAGKTPVGLNKRVLDVLPQSGWAPVGEDDVNGEVSAVSGEKIFSVDYAAGEFSGFPQD